MMKKKRAVIVILLIVAMLCGCSSIFNSTYEYEEDHLNANSDDVNDEISVENYDELVDVLYGFVKNGIRTASIKFYNTDDNVNEIVAKAVQKVKLETPEGAYAVDLISTTITRIVSYNEIDLSISYIKSRAQMDEVEDIVSQYGLKYVLNKALSSWSSSCVIKVKDSSFTEENILSTIQECYYEHPENAMMYPQISIGIYPNDNAERIIEIQFKYTATDNYLKNLQNSATSSADRLITSLKLTENAEDNANQICMELHNCSNYSENYSNQLCRGLYGVFELGIADSEGFALAYKYVCDQMGIECKVINGTYNGENHFWNLVKINDRYYHIDVSQNRLLSDDEVMQQEYRWDAYDWPMK